VATGIRHSLTPWCAAAVLAACSTTTPAPAVTAPVHSPEPTTVTAAAPAPSPAPPRTRNWFELEVGDCLTVLPQIDLGEVAVPLTDCAAPHAAQVFLRAPVEVNAAIAQVADRKCAAGLSSYTGGSGRYSITYLIDSNQDRTANSPLPSTVICLLQTVDGRPLTGSAAIR